MLGCCFTHSKGTCIQKDLLFCPVTDSHTGPQPLPCSYSPTFQTHSRACGKGSWFCPLLLILCLFDLSLAFSLLRSLINVLVFKLSHSLTHPLSLCTTSLFLPPLLSLLKTTNPTVSSNPSRTPSVHPAAAAVGPSTTLPT